MVCKNVQQLTTSIFDDYLKFEWVNIIFKNKNV